MNPVLELRAASRTHGSGATAVEALVAVDLAVSPGELVAVMGPSGSGKSSLLLLAGGLDTATAGEVLVDGAPLDPATMARDPLREQRHVCEVGAADLTVITDWRGAPAKVVWALRAP